MRSSSALGFCGNWSSLCTDVRREVENNLWEVLTTVRWRCMSVKVVDRHIFLWTTCFAILSTHEDCPCQQRRPCDSGHPTLVLWHLRDYLSLLLGQIGRGEVFGPRKHRHVMTTSGLWPCGDENVICEKRESTATLSAWVLCTWARQRTEYVSAPHCWDYSCGSSCPQVSCFTIFCSIPPNSVLAITLFFFQVNQYKRGIWGEGVRGLGRQHEAEERKKENRAHNKRMVQIKYLHPVLLHTISRFFFLFYYSHSHHRYYC